MPLSDEERYRLEQLEYELREDDPRLARKLRSGLVQERPGPRVLLHGLAVLAAFGLLIVGLLAMVTLDSFGGFILLAAGCYWLTVLRHQQDPRQ
ncbi:DUF3040 domain-containing protein [Arthrobacter mangrovi]|uniref:DUF3040 domain-containing protein n=1 Tax=Arthrobacter mangrovi TaxID=2966350 RepID=A0ABQ5N021_9MICC|nr:DUF3040 domain-containing protein [Arthrobacter mangrovi]GLB69571.1 hypothetical protein AHIS1636_40170 [Arthrobacter mangrovi]